METRRRRCNSLHLQLLDCHNRSNNAVSQALLTLQGLRNPNRDFVSSGRLIEASTSPVPADCIWFPSFNLRSSSLFRGTAKRQKLLYLPLCGVVASYTATGVFHVWERTMLGLVCPVTNAKAFIFVDPLATESHLACTLKLPGVGMLPLDRSNSPGCFVRGPLFDS